ncbi:MAG TPA: hypothetical protein VF304_00130 [Casimicrobiaceae bacterium]
MTRFDLREVPLGNPRLVRKALARNALPLAQRANARAELGDEVRIGTVRGRLAWWSREAP